MFFNKKLTDYTTEELLEAIITKHEFLYGVKDGKQVGVEDIGNNMGKRTLTPKESIENLKELIDHSYLAINLSRIIYLAQSMRSMMYQFTLKGSVDIKCMYNQMEKEYRKAMSIPDKSEKFKKFCDSLQQ